MATRFSTSSLDKIKQLLEDKDSENTKRTYKVAKEVFVEYLREKRIPERNEK